MLNFFKNIFSSSKDHVEDKDKYLSESSWWEEVLQPGKRAEWMEELINPATREQQTPPKLFGFMKDLECHSILRVLDVGSGPLSPLAWGVDNGIIHVEAIDPLANIYQELLQKYHIDYPIKPVSGTGESVAKIFEKNSFDVVYSRNALDHSDSPPDCIKNMVNLLKINGILYLEGFENEGTANHWEGLHQWNFHHVDGNLKCTSRSGEVYNLTVSLPLRCFFTYGPDSNRWIRIAFRKTSESRG